MGGFIAVGWRGLFAFAGRDIGRGGVRGICGRGLVGCEEPDGC